MHEVILKKDIYKLGERGDVVRVKNGYARNYLFPQGLAIPADKGSLKQLEQMRAAAAKEAVRLRGDASKQMEALDGAVVRLVVRASLNNQLYGSVSARDIAASLNAQGFGIDRQRIQLTTPIRMLGDYDVPVHIYKELSTTIKVEVRAEGREDEPLHRAKELSAEFEFAPPASPEASAEEQPAEAGEPAGPSSGQEAAPEAADDQAAGGEPAPEAAEPLPEDGSEATDSVGA